MRTRSIQILAVLAAFVGPACQPDTDRGGLPPVGEELVALEKSRCEARGGTWGRGGRSGTAGFVCFRPTRDGNTACTRAGDCEGICLARSGSCAPVTPIFGCNEVLNSLGVQTTLCVD